MPKNIYRLKDGTIVPGVTTIISQLDKPQLIDWAWRLGQEGKDWREERDNAGDIGTLVHETILRFFRHEEICDLDDVVFNCFSKFLNWWEEEMKNAPLHVISERALVSEKYGFGGQLDIFIVTNCKLVDIKTSNGIYESHWLQLAGYDILLKENGYKVDEHQILWLPKDDRFDCPIRTDLRKEKAIFKHLLGIYKLRREE